MPTYSVTVTMTCDDGSTVERTYERGATRMSRANFASFALGDLMRLTGYMPVSWEIVEK